jgi:3-hydroxybutyryl-CoA dehydrogenase
LTKTVGIIGLGTMGRGLSKLCAAKGFDVLVLGRTSESGKRGMSRIKSELRARLDKGKIAQDEFDLMLSKMTLMDEPSRLSAAEIVIEAIYEDVKAKGNLFRDVEQSLGSGTVLVTNTSSISIEELSVFLERPSRLMGLHFFNPPEVMRLVEARRSTKTDEATVSAVCTFAKQLGKTPIMTPDLPGLYVNRILFPMLLESISVLETTKSPIAEIDEAMKLGANLPMGPLELCDFIGNDIVLNISRVLLTHTGDQRFKPPKLLEQMVAEGKLGRKSGRGFYEYR